ncbi:MAG: efflux RND transporter periplasmic adaptor subunit [Thermodesulfobacteriota bacterium]
MSKAEPETLEIRQALKLDKRPRSWIRYLWAVGLLSAAAILIWRFWSPTGGQAMIQYKTAPAVRGGLVVIVSATGTLQPVNKVDVGTEMSGTLRTVEVDFNDPVKKGQVLARLDTAKLEAQKLQYQASLAEAKAQLLNAQADVADTRTNLERLKRAYKMSEGKLPSKQDLDAAEIKLTKALAQVEVIKATIAKAQAALGAVETDLAKAVIRAPIDGLILDRKAEPGQTVVSSLQSPVLFTLAEDLARMYLYVAVDEADVGQVREGQSATFLVDAYPLRRFPARLIQARYTPKTEAGVVTYECQLAVDNADLLLRPGMTATADIIVNQVSEAVLAPNAALRFTPEEPLVAKDSSGQDQRSFLSKIMPGPPVRRRNPNQTEASQSSRRNSPRVWILKDGRPEPIPVTTGVTDGINTELLSGDVQPGQELLVDMTRVEK